MSWTRLSLSFLTGSRATTHLRAQRIERTERDKSVIFSNGVPAKSNRGLIQRSNALQRLANEHEQRTQQMKKNELMMKFLFENQKRGGNESQRSGNES
jgi:hypothetical protein